MFIFVAKKRYKKSQLGHFMISVIFFLAAQWICILLLSIKENGNEGWRRYIWAYIYLPSF